MTGQIVGEDGEVYEMGPNAQDDYDDALTTDGALDVLEARTDVIIAQELYDSAVDNLRAFETGSDSPQVQSAAKAVEQAQAMLSQTRTNVSFSLGSLTLNSATAPTDTGCRNCASTDFKIRPAFRLEAIISRARNKR